MLIKKMYLWRQLVRLKYWLCSYRRVQRFAKTCLIFTFGLTTIILHLMQKANVPPQDIPSISANMNPTSKQIPAWKKSFNQSQYSNCMFPNKVHEVLEMIKNPLEQTHGNFSFVEHCRYKMSSCKKYFIPLRVCEPFVHSFVLANERKCTPETEIVILINSYHSNKEKREAIRETWGKAALSRTWPNGKSGVNTYDGKRAILLFVTALSKDGHVNTLLQQEYIQHRDIVLGDFTDNYQNMTLKSLLGLKWVIQYCTHAKYLLKTDDDVMVNLPLLTSVLDQLGDFSWSIMGPLTQKAKPYLSGKWKLENGVYPFRYFPDYESGSAYVIDGNLLAPLLILSEFFPHIFIDDVYITGILGAMLGVKHIKRAGFAYNYNADLTACDFARNSSITGLIKRQSAITMKEIWKDLIEGPQC